MNHSVSKLKKTEKRIIALFALLFVLWSAAFIYRTSFIAIDGKRYFCLFDDAMISMRYAWNFSHGAGLVWNAGERVQGYTNLLMTLIMSFATLGFDKSTAALAIQILGVGFMLGIAYVNMKIAEIVLLAGEKNPQGALFTVLAFLFPLLYYPLTYWSLQGMETGLLAVLLGFAVLAALRYAKNQSLSFLYQSAVYLGLAFLTRNDSLIFALLIAVYIFWETFTRKPNSTILLQLFFGLILYLIFVAGQFVFQYSYYGELLPNTYTLKLTGMSLADRLSNGFGFILPFLLQSGLLLLMAGIDVVRRFQTEKLLLFLLVASAIGYQIYVGGDPWPYWRMMSPTMPFLGILLIGAIMNGLHAQASRKGFHLKFLTSIESQVSLILLLGIFVANAYFLPEALFLERPFYVSANQHNVNIALALSQVTTPDATLGIFWAGAIPYFAERNGIDFLGKSDRYIAQLPPDLSGSLSLGGMKSPPGHNKYDLNYSIKQLHPTYVQDFKWGTQDLTTWGKSVYVEVQYKGVVLFLLRNSPAVRWDKLNNIQ
jgi:hypothetical protein